MVEVTEADHLTAARRIADTRWMTTHEKAVLIRDIRAALDQSTAADKARIAELEVALAEADRRNDAQADEWNKAEAELASLRAQLAKVREAASSARNVLALSGVESGYCMCGDPVEGHNIGSGHSPVDSHIYMAAKAIEEIDAALSTEETNDAG